MVWDVRFYLSTSCRISSHKDWDQSKNGRERWRNTSLLWSCSVPIRSSKMRKKKGVDKWGGVRSDFFFFCENYHQTDPTPQYLLIWLGGGTKLTVDDFGFPWLELMVPNSRWPVESVHLKSHDFGGWYSRLQAPGCLSSMCQDLVQLLRTTARVVFFFSNLIIYNK